MKVISNKEVFVITSYLKKLKMNIEKCTPHYDTATVWCKSLITWQYFHKDGDDVLYLVQVSMKSRRLYNTMWGF